jgi:hypothetical protein
MKSLVNGKCRLLNTGSKMCKSIQELAPAKMKTAKYTESFHLKCKVLLILRAKSPVRDLPIPNYQEKLIFALHFV